MCSSVKSESQTQYSVDYSKLSKAIMTEYNIQYPCLICHNYRGNKYQLQLHLAKKHQIKISLLTDIIFLLKNTEKSQIKALLNNINAGFKNQIIFNMIFKNYSLPFIKNIGNANSLITESLLTELGSQVIAEYLESLSDQSFDEKEINERENKKEQCDWCSKSFSSKIILHIHEENSHNFLISSLTNSLMQNIEPNIFPRVLEKNQSTCIARNFIKDDLKALCYNNLNDNNNTLIKNGKFYNGKRVFNNCNFKNDHNKRNLQRTKLLDNQLKILWKNFNINCSPNDEELEILAKETSLEKKVIKHWFRNTLFKERQKNIESPYNFNNPPMSLL